MLNTHNVKIHFAHRTFKWSNEAKGKAAVYCVIVGFANFDADNKKIFDYDDVKGEAREINAKNINPYLVDAKNVFIGKQQNPICNVPAISFGSMPNDGGYLLLTDEEKNTICSTDKVFEKYVRPLMSAKEFLNGISKWCLWLEKFNPSDIVKSKELEYRIKKVKEHREKSARKTTQNLARFPALFGEIRQPKSDFILIPRVSSENRKIIPMTMLSADNIVGDTCLAIPKATLYHFGILQSSMHMAWVNTVCGRLGISFRYSNEIVYNNYPFPEHPSDKQIKTIKAAAQKVVNVRKLFADNALDELYRPISMPPALVKAHNELDKAVDLAYRPQPFSSEAQRLEFLFELYEKYTADLFTKKKVKKLKKT
jgi:hypothetical protein